MSNFLFYVRMHDPNFKTTLNVQITDRYLFFGTYLGDKRPYLELDKILVVSCWSNSNSREGTHSSLS